MAPGGRFVWVPDGYHVVISDGTRTTEITQNFLYGSSDSTESPFNSMTNNLESIFLRSAGPAYPADVDWTARGKRLACRKGWRVAQVRIVSVLKRSAKRIRRGFGRENVGCWNYCRSPA